MATTISSLASVSPQIALDVTTDEFLVSTWSDRIRQSLELMTKGERVLENVYDAPRRKHADPTSSSLARAIAQKLYPAAPDSLAPIIQYEKDIVKIRAYIQDQRKADTAAATARRASKDWRKRIITQGPWDEINDPLSLEGSLSLPMPVQVGEKEDFAPFFTHLRVGGDYNIMAGEDAEMKEEPYYNTHMIEFNRGVLYADRRMDLCKMVVGPTHIGDLMESLETNPFTQHFLLGNNIIGPAGAKRIARFVDKYPDRMLTWYLAGNCIDGESFRILVDSLVKSSSVTNVWLKRNPLGPSSASDIFRLITQAPNLRTLDLDQTSLGDAGVAHLFSLLADHQPPAPLALGHIYLNATGVGAKAAEQIGGYLASESCTIVSVYLSNNSLGSEGAKALSIGLKPNKNLERLSLSSCGLKDEGTIQLLNSLSSHPSLRLLDIGQSYATEDLGMRFNWLTEAIVPALIPMIENVRTLRYLALDYTPMSRQGLNTILHAVAESNLLDYNSVKTGQEGVRVSLLVKGRLEQNVAKEYNGKSYDDFLADDKRWLVSPEDVRNIDSVYRNRDAGLARRGMKRLIKLWDDEDDTLEQVKNAQTDSA
ncbi:RNI-like protein [Marasmius fiardii PR-910]|nr:RNI-like protein [Marasmius fiardii PR-910]